MYESSGIQAPSTRGSLCLRVLLHCVLSVDQRVAGADSMWQGFMSQACRWLYITSDHLSVLSTHSMEAPNCKGDGEILVQLCAQVGKKKWGSDEHKVTSATGEWEGEFQGRLNSQVSVFMLFIYLFFKGRGISQPE